MAFPRVAWASPLCSGVRHMARVSPETPSEIKPSQGRRVMWLLTQGEVLPPHRSSAEPSAGNHAAVGQRGGELTYILCPLRNAGL